MSGRLIGAALRGYDRGRRNRQDDESYREERDYRLERRDRQRGEEEWSDPMRKRGAERKEGREIREDDYEAYTDPARRAKSDRGHRAGIRAEGREIHDEPYRRKGVERGERMGGRAEDREIFDEPYRQSGVQRGDRAGDRAEDRELHDEPFRRSGVERGDRAGTRAEERELHDEPFRRRGVERGDKAGDRQEEYGEGDMNQYRREEESNEFSRQADNATSIFDQTGNAQPLADFYNDIYPDDGHIEIEKLPDGMYRADFGEGFGEPKSKDEVLAGSIDFFKNAPQMREETAGVGYGYGGSSRGRSGGRGSSRRGGTTGKQSAWGEKINRTISDLVKYDNMSVGEATMEAHARAAQSSRTPPEEAIQKFYTTMIKEIMSGMGDMSMLDEEEQAAKMEQAKSLAGTMTDSFTEKYFGGGQAQEPGREQPGDAEGNDYLDSLLEDAL